MKSAHWIEQRALQWKATEALRNMEPEPIRGYLHTPVDIEQVRREAEAARQLMEQMK